MSEPAHISEQDVRKLARLARLDVNDAQAADLQRRLGAVMTHTRRIAETDLAGVEPMHSPHDSFARLDADEPAAPLAREVLIGLAPEVFGPFVRTPSVF